MSRFPDFCWTNFPDFQNEAGNLQIWKFRSKNLEIWKVSLKLSGNLRICEFVNLEIESALYVAVGEN